MATSGSATDPYSGRTMYYLWLSVVNAGTVGNTTRYSWTLRAYNPEGRTSTYYNADEPYSVNVEGEVFSGGAGLPFSGGAAYLTLATGTTGYKTHDADGYLTVNYSASHGPIGLFGTAALSGSFAANRIAKAPYTPPQPTLLSATASALNFTIAAPADNGGSAILDYSMDLATDSAFTTIVQTRVSSAAAQTFVGLDPATAYYFRHRARNAVGTGSNSPYRTAATLVAAPSAPLNPSATDLAPTGLTLNWDAPASDGGGTITGYRITRATDAGFTLGVAQFTQGATLSRAFTGLLPSTKYYFKVEAQNSAGYGPTSSALETTTVAGAYYSTGTAWVPVGVFVSDGTDYIAAELLVSDGTDYASAI